jgi:hypothetical protein
MYRMGHEKVASFPFCTCPCDILSGVRILRRVFEQLVNSRAVTISPLSLQFLSFHHLATLLLSVFTLRHGLGLIFRGPSCILGNN